MRPTMLDAHEAAAFLKISYWTILQQARKGLIPHVKVGTRTLFSEEGLAQWVKTEEAKSVAKAVEPENTYGTLRKIKD